MFLLTPHTLEKFTTPQRALFLLAKFLNPSHSWKVHHTHRALCSITPHSWTVHHTHRLVLDHSFNASNSKKVHHNHRALLSRLCSLTLTLLTTPQGHFFVGSYLTPRTLKSKPHPQGSFLWAFNPRTLNT